MNQYDKSIKDRLLFFLTPVDGRYEDLKRGNWRLNVVRDLTAGLIVAMVAIPLAMGFAMASGLRPEQGIVGGAVAGLIGALFGGSKYQVYGPTAAFIPVIAGIMASYNHSFLVLASIIAGALLMLCGVLKLGRIVALVPHSIVVGFTIGIAIVIAFSQMGDVLGITHPLGYNITEQLPRIIIHISDTNVYALVLAIITFLVCKILLRISSFIPAPLIALGFGLLMSATLWSDKNLITIKDEYGSIPTDFLVITPPELPAFNGAILGDLLYYVIAIFLVASIESLLCSRMADRLANNKGLPFNPDKELWGQGMVNIITPLFNGFPHTGALARTAVNIKVGAISPVSGIAKFTFKLLMAAYLAVYLEHVPMACIGGILLYVAHGMVKTKEIKSILDQSRFHIALMIYTAIMVPAVGFMWAVVSAIMIYAMFKLFLSGIIEKKTITDVEAGELISNGLNNGASSNLLAHAELKESPGVASRKTDYYNQLLDNNKKWVASKLKADPQFFSKLAEGQHPPVLWIGCSDSRVPANEITGTQPGEIFVHRNIANVVVHTDMNMLSVLDYAVNILKVKHVIVCGHYGCGGVKAAMSDQQFGLIDNWLCHIKDVYQEHQEELGKIADGTQRETRFVEMNVMEQVIHLSETSIIQNSWQERDGPMLHGWVYDIRNGIIKDLEVTMKNNSEVPEVHRFTRR